MTAGERQKFILGLLAVALFLGGVGAEVCTNGVSISSESIICTQTGATETCNVTFATLLTLPFAGSTFCATIVKDTIPIGIVKIEYESLLEVKNLNLAYYTSSWVLTSQSVHVCGATAPCDQEACPLMPGPDITMGVLTLPELFNTRARTSCRASCGCITCNFCISCASSCVFSGYAITPTGTRYRVYELGQSSVVPRLSVRILQPNGIQLSQTVIDHVGVESYTGPYKTTLVGTLNPPQTDWGYNSVMVNGNTFRLVQCADLNLPQPNICGDIQAATEVELTGTVKNFIYDLSMIREIHGAYATTFTYLNQGVNAISTTSSPTFPLIRSGNLWTSEIVSGSPRIVANITQPAAVFINFAALEPISLTRNVVLVCPRATFVNATGCYSCDAGAVITVSAYSSCVPGLVVVNSPDNYVSVQTGSVYLDGTANIVRISIKVGNPRVYVHLRLVGNGGTAEVEFDLETQSAVVLNEQNENITGGNTTVIRNDGVITGVVDFFSEIFAGTAAWWHQLLLWGGVGILVILALVILPTVISYVVGWFKSAKAATSSMGGKVMNAYQGFNRVTPQEDAEL